MMELHRITTTIYDMWGSHFASDPRALAVRKWTGSII